MLKKLESNRSNQSSVFNLSKEIEPLTKYLLRLALSSRGSAHRSNGRKVVLSSINANLSVMSAQPTVTAEDKKFNLKKRKSSLSGQDAEDSYFSAKPADGRKLRNKLTNRDINTTADGAHTSQESILEMLKAPTNGN